MEDCSFKLTGANMNMLNALCKYAMMLDHVTHSKETEALNIDGVINYILDEALKKEIQSIAKRHGFTGVSDFVESLELCNDGESVHLVITEAERASLQQKHDKILAQIPFEDKQACLPL